MKIVVLSAHTNSLFWFRMDMMKEFLALGHEVIAIGNEPELEWKESFNEVGIEYKAITIERNGLNPRSDVRTLIQLSKIFREIKPDKIFIYQAKTIAYGSIAAKLNNISDVYLLIAGLGSILRGVGLKNKIIKTILQFQYKIAIKYSKHVFFHNKDDRNELIRLKLVSEKKSTVLNGSGVNTEFFKPIDLPKETAFIFIGRLIRDKGIFEYLEACRVVKDLFPEVKCFVVGPFDSNPSSLKREELQNYIDKGIVIYYGEQKDVRPYLSKVSTLILPSYHEGRAKTILEAMAMGRSIITTDAPGCRDSVKDGVNGIVVPIKDIKSLANAMIQLVAQPELNGIYGKRNIKEVIEKYDSTIVNKEINKTMNIGKEY